MLASSFFLAPVLLSVVSAGFVAMRLCGSAALWLCGFVALLLCDLVALWICAVVVLWPHCFMAFRLFFVCFSSALRWLLLCRVLSLYVFALFLSWHFFLLLLFVVVVVLVLVVGCV